MIRGPKVLVAEEDPLCRSFIEMSLRAEGCDVVALEGCQAVARVLEFEEAQTYDCLITGYSYRGTEDMGLLSRIAELDPSLAVVVTGTAGTDSTALRSLRTGAFDFLEKPLSRDRLFNSVLMATAATAKRRQATRIKAGVHAAGLVQKTLLGSVLSDEGIAIESCFRPRESAGGDFLAHYRLPGGQDLVLVTDVSGHEFDAAVMSSFFHGMARGLIESGVPVADVLTRYNRVLLTTPGFEARPSSLAVCCLVIDYDKDLMTTLLAGSAPPAWVDDRGIVQGWTGSMSSPLGWFLESGPAVAVSPVPKSPVWIWTDGVEDLAAQLGAHPLSIASALIRSVSDGSEPEWLAGARDDVLAVRLWPTSSTLSRGEYLEPVVADRYGKRHIEEIDGLQTMWLHSLEIAFPGLDSGTVFNVLLASREAVLNAIRHGCKDEQEAVFQIAHRPEANEIVVQVRDPGNGYVAEAAPSTGELGDGHRGLLLIQNLASSVLVEKRGAVLIMTFNKEAKEDETTGTRFDSRDAQPAF